jgi:PAS domain S-box-containing protein
MNRLIQCAVHNSPPPDDSPLSVIIDNTLLTEALHESEERFRTLLSDIPAVSVQGYDADGNVIFWNQASHKLYGYTREEALGRNLVDLIIPPPMRETVKSAIAQMVRTLKPIPAGPLDLMRKDGSLIPVYSSHAVINVPGHGFELYCLDIDLSDLKRTEEALAQEKREAAVLQQHLQQASKMDAIGRLAGGVAHDFNNLLQAILGFTEILLEEAHAGETQHDNLMQIKKAGTRAADLTRQLLAFSRKQMTEPHVININANVAGALKMLQRLLGEDIVLQSLPDPFLLPIKADPGQIDQVILNLAVNARDAMPNGGRLTIRTSMVSLNSEDASSIPESYPGTFVCLAMSDNGTGMDSETMGHLFEPFFTTKQKEKGSGLGLAVIYGILKQNKGWINVYSRIGQGSTFNLFFPSFSNTPAPVEEPASLHEDPAEAKHGYGETVLLVEDEPDVRALAATILQNHGYRVLQACSTVDALALFDRHGDQIDLLFSDVVLSGATGIDLAEQLLHRKPSLHIMLTSGYADERARWSVIEARGYRFLQKPYPCAMLLTAVRELLDG